MLRTPGAPHSSARVVSSVRWVGSFFSWSPTACTTAMLLYSSPGHSRISVAKPWGVREGRSFHQRSGYMMLFIMKTQLLFIPHQVYNQGIKQESVHLYNYSSLPPSISVYPSRSLSPSLPLSPTPSSCYLIVRLEKFMEDHLIDGRSEA